MNFYDNLKKCPSQVAIISEHIDAISYQDLLIAADNLGVHIKRRALVFVVCKNCFESVVGYIGLLRVRAVLVLVDYSINPSFFSNLLATYHPEYVYLPTEFASLNLEYLEIYAFGNYRLLKTNYAIDYALHDDLALLLTTSGSTGSPKLVRQSYKNIESNAEAIAQYLEIAESDRPITTMPMSYTYGLSIINSHLLRGATLVLTETTLMERKFWEIMETHKITNFGGVPYIYEMLKKLRFARMDLSHLRYITQAGGKLNSQLVVEFVEICANKEIEFYVMYGQTEATARMAYLPWEQARVKADSIGIAIPGGKFWLEDEFSQVIIDNDVVGELVYQGDNVTLGYAEDRFALGKGDENRGVLHTGDLAKRDSDGFYYIIGRKNRFLKMFGNRVNLNEVEQIIKAAGYDCACAGIDDCLKIYINKAQERDIDRLKRNIAELMGINQAGISIIAIAEIPRNAAGKVLYSILEKSQDDGYV